MLYYQCAGSLQFIPSSLNHHHHLSSSTSTHHHHNNNTHLLAPSSRPLEESIKLERAHESSFRSWNQQFLAANVALHSWAMTESSDERTFNAFTRVSQLLSDSIDAQNKYSAALADYRACLKAILDQENQVKLIRRDREILLKRVLKFNKRSSFVPNHNLDFRIKWDDLRREFLDCDRALRRETDALDHSKRSGLCHALRLKLSKFQELGRVIQNNAQDAIQLLDQSLLEDEAESGTDANFQSCDEDEDTQEPRRPPTTTHTEPKPPKIPFPQTIQPQSITSLPTPRLKVNRPLSSLGFKEPQPNKPPTTSIKSMNIKHLPQAERHRAKSTLSPSSALDQPPPSLSIKPPAHHASKHRQQPAPHPSKIAKRKGSLRARHPNRHSQNPTNLSTRTHPSITLRSDPATSLYPLSRQRSQSLDALTSSMFTAPRNPNPAWTTPKPIAASAYLSDSRSNLPVLHSSAHGGISNVSIPPFDRRREPFALKILSRGISKLGSLGRRKDEKSQGYHSDLPSRSQNRVEVPRLVSPKKSQATSSRRISREGSVWPTIQPISLCSDYSSSEDSSSEHETDDEDEDDDCGVIRASRLPSRLDNSPLLSPAVRSSPSLDGHDRMMNRAWAMSHQIPSNSTDSHDYPPSLQAKQRRGVRRSDPIVPVSEGGRTAEAFGIDRSPPIPIGTEASHHHQPTAGDRDRNNKDGMVRSRNPKAIDASFTQLSLIEEAQSSVATTELDPTRTGESDWSVLKKIRNAEEESRLASLHRRSSAMSHDEKGSSDHDKNENSESGKRAGDGSGSNSRHHPHHGSSKEDDHEETPKVDYMMISHSIDDVDSEFFDDEDEKAGEGRQLELRFANTQRMMSDVKAKFDALGLPPS